MAEQYKLTPVVDAPVLKDKLSYDIIKLDSIDLSLYKEGDENLHIRKQLAKQLEQSVTTLGFFNLTNYGIDAETENHIRSIGQLVLNLPDDVKARYLAGALTKEDDLKLIALNKALLGGERSSGYKPKKYWNIKDGVRDAVDHYNFRGMLHEEIFNEGYYPDAFRAHLKDVADYYNYIHNVILKKLSNLVDLILEIPEGTFWDSFFKVIPNDVPNSGGGHGRFMLYHPYESLSESQKVGNVWLRGHSDISAFSFLTSNPMLSLQIKDYFSGDWKYVDYVPNSLIVNVGDALEFITGGYFKLVLHRVMLPPAEQQAYERLVLIYFCNPKSKLILDPEPLKSEKLDALGYNKSDKLKDWDKITFKDWDDYKGRTLGIKGSDEKNTVQVFGRAIERWHFFEKPLVAAT